MLAAVNINLVAFEAVLRTPEAIGQVFTIFVITVAAAEVGIGLAIETTPQPEVGQRRRARSDAVVRYELGSSDRSRARG